LNEGSVELLLENNSPVLIKPGELAIVNHTKGDFTITNFNSINVNAWMSNKLIFENTPLIEVVQRLEQVLGVTFTYPENLETTLISTTIPSLDAEVAAKILSETLEAEFGFSGK